MSSAFYFFVWIIKRARWVITVTLIVSSLKFVPSIMVTIFLARLLPWLDTKYGQTSKSNQLWANNWFYLEEA